MKKQVIINLDVEGFHYWQNAPDSVDFLRSNHRHIFNIKGWYDVEDLDREVEIFLLQWEVSKYVKDKWGEPAIFGGMSCEMIAMDLLERFNFSAVEVLEDYRGGGRVCQ
jgi:hypothetical protein